MKRQNDLQKLTHTSFLKDPACKDNSQKEYVSLTLRPTSFLIIGFIIVILIGIFVAILHIKNSITTGSNKLADSNSQESAQITVSSERIERDGFSTETDVVYTVNGIDITLPSYWGKNINETGYECFAQQEEGSSLLEIQTIERYGETWRESIRDITEGCLSSLGIPLNKTSENYTVDDFDIYIVTADFLEDESEFSGVAKLAIVNTEDYDSVVVFLLIVEDDTKYLYNNDFNKMLNTIASSNHAAGENGQENWNWIKNKYKKI